MSDIAFVERMEKRWASTSKKRIGDIDQQKLLELARTGAEAADLITTLRAEVASKNEQFQQYARKMETDMNALAAQNEKLRAALKWLADKYDEAIPLRTADFHISDCTCMRCARDNARAELEKKTKA